MPSRFPLAAALAASLLPSPAQARSSQWWFVAQGADRVLFVDVGSIERKGDAVTYQVSQVLREAGNPAALIRAFMRTDCARHEEEWPLLLRYGADDRRLDETALSYPDPQRVEPGTLGDAQLQFVCAADRAQAGGFPLAIDEVAFAEALIADRDATQDPAALHERLRADPATPVIRSTAPGPASFGTIQTVAAGSPVVPPRDYAKGTQVPAASEYDADETGTIYDIVYNGIEDGEVAFELRGYDIVDLAHAGSGQTMRFPLGQKTVQIRDITIDILEARPEDLRFRATRVPAGE
jgi:hypothetical protein